MTAARILAIGDELVHGRGIDTNSAWIARALGAAGMPVRGMGVVGDGVAEIAHAIRESAQDARLVVMTGGLGPTEDDRTRHGAAAAAGVELEFDQGAWRQILRYFEQRQRPVAESNRRQALRPRGARVLANRHGSAPGFRLTLGNAEVIALPGVPREVAPMFEEHVLPLAHELAGGGELAYRELKVLGPTEAAAGEAIADLMREGHEPRVGITVHSGLIVVRIVATGAGARAAADAALVQARARLAEHVVDEGPQSLAESLAARLLDQDVTLALAESCTGGMLAAQITAVPGISRVLRAGYVVYADDAKTRDLEVPKELLERCGAVSTEVAQAMALGAARRAGARLALAVTGIAGPGGGSAAKPVGTVCFGLVLDGAASSCERRFPDLGRAWIRERSCIEAQALAIRALDARADARAAAFPQA